MRQRKAQMDVMKRVKAADPVKEQHVKGWVDTEEANEIRQRILSSATLQPHRPKRRLTSRVVLFPAALLVIISATAALYVSSRATSDPFSLACASGPDLQSLAVVAVKEGQSPEQTCASQWQSMFDSSTPATLTACVIDAGGTVVFPNKTGMGREDFCASVGASVPSGGPQYGGLTAQGVRDLAADTSAEVADLREGEHCYPLGQLRESIQSILDERNLSEWGLRDETTAQPEDQASNGQPCARLVFAPLDAQIILYNGSHRGR